MIGKGPTIWSIHTVKKCAAKLKKFCKILQTSKTPTAMVKELAAFFLTVQ